MGKRYRSVIFEWFIPLMMFGIQIEVISASCDSDSDCSPSESQLCCEGYCVPWDKCKDSCSKNKDCDSSRNQICYTHRCLEESLTYPDVACVTNDDCENKEHCEDNKCVKTITTSHQPEQLTWIKVVFISGSVILTLMVCAVFYCYRKRCAQRQNETSFISMETRSQNVTDEGYHVEISPGNQTNMMFIPMQTIPLNQ